MLLVTGAATARPGKIVSPQQSTGIDVKGTRERRQMETGHNKQTKLDARGHPDVRARDLLDQDGATGAAAWASVAGVNANAVRCGGGRDILVLLTAADGQVGALTVVCEGECTPSSREGAL